MQLRIDDISLTRFARACSDLYEMLIKSIKSIIQMSK